jgi:hypothetical protein
MTKVIMMTPKSTGTVSSKDPVCIHTVSKHISRYGEALFDWFNLDTLRCLDVPAIWRAQDYRCSAPNGFG